jgi:hypothetical protein
MKHGFEEEMEFELFSVPSGNVAEFRNTIHSLNFRVHSVFHLWLSVPDLANISQS